MEKYYTLGEVVDNMKIGEVAVKVEGSDGIISDELRLMHTPTGSAMFFDENDGGVLKNLSNGKDVLVGKRDDVKPYKYVIMSIEAYKKIINK